MIAPKKIIENEWRAFKKRTGIQSSLKINMIATRIMKKFSLAAMPVSHLESYTCRML
jgi:hypothetical protein